MKTQNKLVLVEWQDSNVMHGWMHNECANEGIAHCRIVGILQSEDADKVVVAFGDSDYGMVLETVTIPKACIIRIRELRVK